MSKCEACIHKKNCIDGVNYRYAAKCKRYREEAGNDKIALREEIDKATALIEEMISILKKDSGR